MGIGEAFRDVVIHPGKYEFEAKNPSTLFVALEHNQQVEEVQILILHFMRMCY